MFFKIFSFELYYRFQRNATYVYLLLTFALSFALITSPTARLAGAVGHVHANAPYVIAVAFIVLSFVMTIVCSAIMGFAMIRDAEHNFEAILFTTRAGKFEYLFGRFAGSLTVLLLMGIASWLGLATGYALGSYMPWEVAWKHTSLLPQNFWQYLQPFLYFMVTNLFVNGVFFFVTGALVRNTIVLYAQGLLLLLVYQLSNQFLQSLESKELASLVDPLGVIAFGQVTQYWTPFEKNTRLVPFEGLMLWNRLLWLGVAFIGLLLTYIFFSFRVGSKSLMGIFPKRSSPETSPAPGVIATPVPLVKERKPPSRYLLHISLLLRSAWLYFRMITREIPFLAIMVCGVVVFLATASKMNEMYGTSSYPTTFAILKLIDSFTPFLLIIAVFYSGELMWLEQRHGFHQITLALPVSALSQLTSKVIGLTMVFVSIILMLIIGGIIVQAAHGYTQFEPGVYLGTLFGSTFTTILLLTFLCFLIQALARNKFLGFALSITVILAEGMVASDGVDADFLLYTGGGLGVYSDMNGYGHHVLPFVWMRLYWLALGVILFLIAAAIWSRPGSANGRNWIKLWSDTDGTIVRPILISLSVFLLAFVILYYNSRILNFHETQAARSDRLANYERKLKTYDSIVQPKIVGVSLTVELNPSRRNFSAQGHYYLKNKSKEVIPEVHLQLSTDPHLGLDTLWFDRSFRKLEVLGTFRYARYSINPPLSPGDSLRMDFGLTFEARGFELKGSNDQIVYNGTFLNQSYFPSLGYNSSLEITDMNKRFEYGLQPRGAFASKHNSALNQYGDDADHIRLDMVIGTEGDQIAVAPGDLHRTWSENGRNYYHYKSAVPMGNFYSILSGRYTVYKDSWNGVALEIYHHPDHSFNVERMTEAMKDALDFCSAHFGKFPHRALRIVEFPRYSTFAQSFSQTIPYSEGMGFVFKVSDPNKDLDMAYYGTAHEVAHQWWGQLIMQSNTKGGSLLSEGLAQYTALMVLKKRFPPEVVERYLRYELTAYLTGRSAEREKEETLVEAEGRNYLHYSKAALAFFAIQDYLGEDRVNRALGNFARRWAMRESPYSTSQDLMSELRAVTPDSLQYLIVDLFESITLHENVATQCHFEKIGADQYELSLKVGARKFLADSVGRETELPVPGWIDIGVYGRDTGGTEKLIYLKKHKINSGEQVINLTVKGRPVRAGIDPLHKLIDRHPGDNTVEVKEVVDLATIPLF